MNNILQSLQEAFAFNFQPTQTQEDQFKPLEKKESKDSSQNDPSSLTSSNLTNKNLNKDNYENNYISDNFSEVSDLGSQKDQHQLMEERINEFLENHNIQMYNPGDIQDEYNELTKLKFIQLKKNSSSLKNSSLLERRNRAFSLCIE